MHTDFAFYTTKYHGTALSTDNADKWLDMASDEVDMLTRGRLLTAFPTDMIHAEKVCKAVCAVADVLFQIDLQRKVTAVQQAADGTYRGAVASISSGRESISYAVNASASSVYAAAAASDIERSKLITNTAVKYLANIPDATGVNLLYGGV